MLPRMDVERLETLALQPTQTISAWPEKIPLALIMSVAEGLLDGASDSGWTTLKVAEDNSGKFRIDCTIGSPDDPGGTWTVSNLSQ